ncbi:cyclic nucleotide-binding domain-containing protein [bacterium]|nr:cyclic nucleotide-binding domain-containing protein [bacterium]
MKRRLQSVSPKGKIVVNKLDPGVFVVEITEKDRRISFGQPPDVVKRLQQVGYYGRNAVNSFVLVDSKIQDDSICWVLVEFPILYALYLCLVESEGKLLPAFYAGQYPTLIGLEPDVQKALMMIKYGNYGVDRLEELDDMDIPEGTRDALRKEILGLSVGNEIKDSHSFVNSIHLDPKPKGESDYSDIGDGVYIGRLDYNRYRIIYQSDSIDIDVSLEVTERFRAPVEYKHLKFPITNFGIWHTGEFDGMDPYNSCAHTTVIHKYEPIMIDYPSNMTDIINHNGLSKQSIHHILVTHNHDDHIGAMVELFRRNSPCHIITTEPVKFSVVRKISTLVDIPEKQVENCFSWTILPFLKENPYQTETYNLEGIKITGHLSCHSVPTTVYSFDFQLEGDQYRYGHFLDIVAFKRMKKMVKDGWMPEAHLEHLDNVIRKQTYDLIKYDAGCATENSLPFTVHGQWQDLKKAKTERSNRVFTHVTKSLLSKDYEKEGRFVRVGDLDKTIRMPDGSVKNFGVGLDPVIPYFFQAFNLILDYFKSILGDEIDDNQYKTMRYYAYVFANTPTQVNPNIGTFMIEQGDISDSVYIIVRGRAEFLSYDSQGEVIARSGVGDGEVMGDIGVLARQPRMASVKTLNRLRFLRIPASLFIEAMNALNVNYDGYFKEMFERRLILQSASDFSQDLSTTVLNRIARNSHQKRVLKGDALIKIGEHDKRLFIANGPVVIKIGEKEKRFTGPDLVGECEFFLQNITQNDTRLHTVTALEDIDVLEFEAEFACHVPVIIDNIRRVIRQRRKGIYLDLPQVDQTL